MSNYCIDEDAQVRQQRARIIYTTAGIIAFMLGFYLLWALRGLIVPTVIGILMAYIFLPLIGYLKKKGFSRTWAVIWLFGLFCLALFSSIKLTGDLIPDQKTELEIQARIRYKLNERFDDIMGLKENRQDGNLFYALFGKELEPLRKRVDKALQMSDAKDRLFSKYYKNPQTMGSGAVEERYWRYHQANRQRDRLNDQMGDQLKTEEESESGANFHQTGKLSDSSLLLTIFNAISIWLITPLIFLILLVDDGKLKRELIQSVPNRYFELTLTTLDNINEALGRYLRGTFIECFLVGTSFTICLFLIGLEMQWAAAIGIIAGLANAIPFLGPAIGLLVGLLYAIMAENISPVLPFVNIDNLLTAVIVVVAIVQLADNAIFQPYILGGAVDLHPITVVFGVMGGAVIFGFAGMLFAVPAIMIAKVVVTTMFRQLNAYNII